MLVALLLLGLVIAFWQYIVAAVYVIVALVSLCAWLSNQPSPKQKRDKRTIMIGTKHYPDMTWDYNWLVDKYLDGRADIDELEMIDANEAIDSQ